MPKSIIIVVFLFLLSLGFAQAQDVLAPAVFKKQIKKKRKIQLIDVRKPEEYAEGHLKNAQNIDYYAEDFKARLAQLNKNKPIYLYCRSGGRSGKTATMLREMGFSNVYDLQGGITQWKNEKLPVQSPAIPLQEKN
ncbi:MAG: rhodanese-like domain-containing protein [Microscillaceae bacterium]|jgi:rhodanese-related sulfurtransferase|nr:rhodanese-like domain-containing protein [Microscillaceae bacterium]